MRHFPGRVLLLFLAALCCASLEAQTVAAAGDAARAFTQINLGESLAPLNGPWKFTVGDSPLDPATRQPLWAEPGFDDSHWETVDLAPKARSFDPVRGLSGYVPGWTAKGHPGYWGYAWYRIRLKVISPPGAGLSIAGSEDVDDAYQVYAGGVLLGSFGDFSGPHPEIYYTQPSLFVIEQNAPRSPDAADPSSKTEAVGSNQESVVLAFRFWMQPTTLLDGPDLGGMHTAPVIGTVSAAANLHQVHRIALIRSFLYWPLLVLLHLLAALGTLALLRLDRKDPLYWWMGLVFLLTFVSQLESVVAAWSQSINAFQDHLLQEVFYGPLIFAGWTMVWWTWFKPLRKRWLPYATAVLVALLMVSNALGENLFYNLVPQSVGNAFHTASLLLRLALMALMLMIVGEGIREQGLEGWLTLPAVLLLGVSSFTTELSILHLRLTLFPWGIQIGLGFITNLLRLLVLALLLVRRTERSQARQRLMALDVKQAQEVQQVIIPQARLTLPGFAVESEYRPALEVGGDFFQVLPHPSDGGLLIVAGDVAGKGLQAGMLVALLIGAARTAAELDNDPVYVLRTLNHRLCGRENAQATAQALLIDTQGQATLANAGHMTPYLNGNPLEMEGALPLGLIEAAEPSVMHFQMNLEDRMVLFSDGILEAMNSKGELFGFERVGVLLAQQPSACEIADAAQKFGQEDDISVVAVTRTGVAGGVPA